MIARIKRRQEALGMRRVTGDLVQVDDRTEVAASADPFIDGLPI